MQAEVWSYTCTQAGSTQVLIDLLLLAEYVDNILGLGKNQAALAGTFRTIKMFITIGIY